MCAYPAHFQLIWRNPATGRRWTASPRQPSARCSPAAAECVEAATDNSADALIAAAFGLTDNVPTHPLRLLGGGHDPGTHHWACADPRCTCVSTRAADPRRRPPIAIDAAEAGQLVRLPTTILPRLAKPSNSWPRPRPLAPAPRRPRRFQDATALGNGRRRVERQLPEESGTAWLRRLLQRSADAAAWPPGQRVAHGGRPLTINSLWLWGQASCRRASAGASGRSIAPTAGTWSGQSHGNGLRCSRLRFAELQQAAPPTAGYW